MVDFIGIERVQRARRPARRGALHRGAGAGDRGGLPCAGTRSRSRRAMPTHSAGGRDRADAGLRRAAVRLQVRQRPSREHRAWACSTVTAFGVLADVATGYPLLLSELTLTTALRTAATSALAARRMARPDSRVMALIGNGAQSEFQTIAFHHMLGIRELRLFDTDPAPPTSSSATSRGCSLPACRSVRCASTAAAVRGRRHRHHRDRRQVQRHDPHPGDDRAGHASERGRRRLPGQDRAAPRTSCAARCARRGRVRAAVAHRGRDPADASRLPGHRAHPRARRQRAGPRRRRTRSRCSIRSASRSRTSPRCAICMRMHQEERGTQRADRPGAGPGGPEGPVCAAGGRARRRAARCGARGVARVSTVRAASLIGAPTDIGAGRPRRLHGPGGAARRRARRGAARARARGRRPRQPQRPGESLAAAARRLPPPAAGGAPGTSWCTRRCTPSCAAAACRSCSAAITASASARSARWRATAASRAGSCACCGSMRTPTSTPAS